MAGDAAPPPATDPKNQVYYRSIPLHLIPRDRPVMRPLELSQVMAHAYARFRKLYRALNPVYAREPLSGEGARRYCCNDYGRNTRKLRCKRRPGSGNCGQDGTSPLYRT